MAKPDPRVLFSRWVDAHAPELFRFAYRLTGNHQVTEDLVQETFTEAWKSIGSQREPDKARAWLFQILRYRHAHRIRDERRRVQATPLVEGIDLPHQDRPVSDVLADRETLRVALEELSPDVRETFLLVFMQGLKCREAAEELHVPLGTVLSRINRARMALRSRLHVDGSLERTPSQPHAHRDIGGRETP